MDREKAHKVYGQWAGNPDGKKEDFNLCVTGVWSGWHEKQCSRKRGYGPNEEHCKQHAKLINREGVGNE